jgi:hypothetical protein
MITVSGLVGKAVAELWDNTAGTPGRRSERMHTQEELERVQQDLDRFTRDMLYFDQHREELLQQYPERWVAVYNQQVVGAAKDPKRLVRQLQRKGIPPGQVFREYLTEEEVLLIL